MRRRNHATASADIKQTQEQQQQQQQQKEEEQAELFVLVVAHPDDESLFFLPTIRGLQNDNHSIWLVCLTTGNYDGLGTIRCRELRTTCRQILQIDRLLVLDDPEHFPDDPHPHAWSLSIPYIAEAIQKELVQALKEQHPQQQYRCMHLITFDRHGVSGHVNHCDTFRAVQQLANRQIAEQRQNSTVVPLLPPTIQVWSLETIHNPVVKYIPVECWVRLCLHWLAWWGRCILRHVVGSSVLGGTTTTTHSERASMATLSSPYNNSNDRVVVCYRLHDPYLNWRAMASHASQFVWYRRLFVIFSCYTYVNRLHAVVMDDHDETKGLKG